MYKLVFFSIELRREDEYSPLVGFELVPNKKNKLFSLLVQEHKIVWSERYKCYILPDSVITGPEELFKYLNIINEALKKIKSNEKIDEELLERERMQAYYTQECLVDHLTSYINKTVNKDSLVLDPAAGIGNLTDKINLSKDRIYVVEPDKESSLILKEKGYIHVFNTTFEEYLKQSNHPSFTHVIMNPPFKDRLDLVFFNGSFELLREHGHIAAITSENSIYEELEPLGLTFNIDFPSNPSINNFENVSELLQEYINNLHNTRNGWMDITDSFDNTGARAYYILAEKEKRK